MAYVKPLGYQSAALEAGSSRYRPFNGFGSLGAMLPAIIAGCFGMVPSQAGVAPTPPPPPPLEFVSEESAYVGPGSTANYHSRTAQTDLVPNTTFLLKIYKSANTGNQCFWACCGAGVGWHITSSGGANGRIDLYQVGGAGLFYMLNGGGILPNDFHDIAITCTPAGAWRASLNGGAPVLLSATPAYNLNTGASLETINRVNPAVNTFPVVAGGTLSVAVLDRSFSDTELQAASAQRSAINNFQFSDTIRTDPTLRYEHHFYRDWDGSSATSVSGLGSAPATFNRQGTGGAKVAIPAFTVHRFSSKADLLNCMFFSETEMASDGFGPLLQTNHFAGSRFTTAGAMVQIDVAAKSNGDAIYAGRIGISVNGVYDAAIDQIVVFNTNQVVTRMGLAGSNIIEATCGYHEYEGAHYDYGNGLSIRGIRVPVSAPATFDLAPPAAKMQITYNSMSGRVMPGSGTVTNSVTQSIIGQIRAKVRASVVPAWANGDVIGDGWGGRNWANFIKPPSYWVGTQSARRDYMIALQLSGLNGTTKNLQFWCLGPNDYILNSYGDLVPFKADLGAYLDRFKFLAEAAGIPGMEYYLSTAVPKTTEVAIPFPGGNTLAMYRAAEVEVCSTRPWITLVDGTTLSSVSDLGDGLHFTLTGCDNYANAHQALIGY